MRLLFILLFLLAPALAWSADTDDLLDLKQELQTARALIEAEDYNKAELNLQSLLEQEYQSADGWNLLGFAQRKLGKLAQSGKSYAKALKLNPKHKGALEYQGELLLLQNNLAAAKANLLKLSAICPDGCEEYTDLQEAITRASQ